MTDDICGAPCDDDTPCQHPAGSCPVASHSDADAENNQGRDFAIDESNHDDILEAAREGLSESGCARAAGVSWQALDRYLDAYDEFRSAFTRARAQGEQRIVREGLNGDVETSMAKFLLSSSFDYVKAEKREVDATHEHSGPDGGPMQIEFNETVVDTAWEPPEDDA